MTDEKMKSHLAQKLRERDGDNNFGPSSVPPSPLSL